MILDDILFEFWLTFDFPPCYDRGRKSNNQIASYKVGNMAQKFLPDDRKSSDYEGD